MHKDTQSPDTTERENRLKDIRNQVRSLELAQASMTQPPAPETFLPGCIPGPRYADYASVVRMPPKEVYRLNQDAVFDTLSKEGVRLVVGDFDGYDDSGQLSDLRAVIGERLVDIPSCKLTYFVEDGIIQGHGRWKEVDLESAIELLIFRRLEDAHSGWEIGCGAEGDFCLDVENRLCLGQIFMLGENDGFPRIF
ncbi:MAG: hypothetical protein V2I43_15855 [Parvularcula sp.]|jgi:hypothetical protein|nr:hypothetical protein [Parvularcula sp.]